MPAISPSPGTVSAEEIGFNDYRDKEEGKDRHVRISEIYLYPMNGFSFVLLFSLENELF